MKKLLFIMVVLLLFMGIAYSALTTSIDTRGTWNNAYRFTGSGADFMLDWCIEVEDLVDDWDGDTWTSSTHGGTFGQSANNVFTWTETPSDLEDLSLTFGANAATWSTSSGVVLSFGTLIPNLDGLDVDGYIFMNPVASPPAGNVEGHIYADTDNQLYYYDGSGWRDLTAGASGITDLDTAYDGGITIDADAGAVAISNNDDDDSAWILTLNHSPGTGASLGGLQITGGANATADCLQIANSGSGDDIQAGAGAFTVSKTAQIVGLDLDVTGAAGVTLQNDGTITNTTDGTILFTEAGESIGFAFTSNVATLNAGATGVVTLGFGDVDALIGIDEVAFDTTTTSTITKAGTANSDFTVSQSGAADNSLILSSTGTTGDALQITTSAGGMDITNAGAAGGEDLDITSSASSVRITAAEDVADAVYIDASGGGIILVADGASGQDIDVDCESGSIIIDAGEASVDDAITITATGTNGGIDITSLGDIDITTSGANGEDILITNTGGSIQLSATESVADAIKIGATAGGIQIFASGAADTEDIAITATGSSVFITSTQSATDAIYLHASAGGIDITAASGGSGEDIDILTTGATDNHIIITSSGTSDDAITLNASAAAGGIELDCGTGGFDLLSTGGGVSIIGQAASTLSVTSGAGSEDLTISVTGTGDSSILMTSIGTAADAFSVQVTGASGGIDIDTTNDGPISIISTDILTLQATTASDSEDLSITLTGATASSILIQSAGTDVDAISLTTVTNSGDITINSHDKIDMDSGGTFALNTAGDTLLIQVDADSGNDDLTIKVDGDQDASIILDSDGTGADSISMTTSAGGLSFTASHATGGDVLFTVGNDYEVDATGKVTLSTQTASDDIKLDAEAGSLYLDSGEDVADAITLVCTSGDGGIDITSLGPIDIITTGASGGAQDITITNTGGSFIVSATEDAVDAISLNATAGTLKLDGDDGVDIDGGANGDVTINSTGQSVLIVATESVATAISLTASTSAGGITLDAGTGLINFSDDALANVGAIACDEISDEATPAISYQIKTRTVTIGHVGDATADHQWTTGAGHAAQNLDLTAIVPAFARVIDVTVICTESVVGQSNVLLTVGSASAGNQFIAQTDCDTINESISTAAGGASFNAIDNAASKVWVGADPDDGNWTDQSAGIWSVMVTYIDNDAAKDNSD